MRPGEAAMPRHPSPNERGAAAVTVALSLIVLIGFAALAVDGASAYTERRATQQAADNASLAAAWEKCNPRSSSPGPIQAGIDAAVANGYLASEVTVTQVSGSPNRYRAEITTVQDNNFGGVIGADTITVASEAEVECEAELDLSGSAVFAGATSCPGVELSLTGASQIVNGSVHSNGSVQLTGSSVTINGIVTYMEGSAPGGVDSIQLEPPALDYPPEFNLDRFSPGGDVWNLAVAAGEAFELNGTVRNNTLGGTNNGSVVITQPGIYYIDGSLSLSNVSLGGDAAIDGVTFVVTGKIDIQGSGDLKGYAEIYQNDYTIPGRSEVLLMGSYYPTTGSTCNGNIEAISFSASDAIWVGIIFAPNGEVRMSNAQNFAAVGGIFSYKVDLSGSDISITRDPRPPEDFRFTVDRQK
jgi:Flp pilus assembly protein TadG